MSISLLPGDTAVVEQALTQWSLEVGDCSSLDGSFVVGTMLETMASSLEDVASATTIRGDEEKRASPRSSSPVSAVLDASECQTVVETLATLLQLRWIFQRHPTTTIYSLLSAQQQQQQGSDTTSRDYLLLKGVLAHGLTNELEFRIQQQQQQGAIMTRNEVEDRICLLTKLLFKHLQEQKKKESLASLQRSYTVLLGS